MNRKKMVAGFWVVILVASALAYASTIKVWSSGEALRPSDLNDNFAHIHNLMVGGHGARLVNADVSASAAIAQSKIAGYAAFPKGWAHVAASCTSNPCTIADQSGSFVTSIARVGAGIYTVTLGTAPANAAFGVQIAPTCPTGTTGAVPVGVSCGVTGLQTIAPQFTIDCWDVSQLAYGTVGDGGSARVDCGFTITVWDED